MVQCGECLIRRVNNMGQEADVHDWQTGLTAFGCPIGQQWPNVQSTESSCQNCAMKASTESEPHNPLKQEWLKPEAVYVQKLVQLALAFLLSLSFTGAVDTLLPWKPQGQCLVSGWTSADWHIALPWRRHGMAECQTCSKGDLLK